MFFLKYVQQSLQFICSFVHAEIFNIFDTLTLKQNNETKLKKNTKKKKKTHTKKKNTKHT